MFRNVPHNLIKPISEKIYKKEISVYLEDDNKTLNTNLAIARKVVNKLRKIYHLSPTHPGFNLFSTDVQKHYVDCLNHVRNHVGLIPFFVLCFSFASTRCVINEIQSSTSESTGIGNCEEMAHSALRILNEKHPELTAEIYTVTNGDHIFLVINREQNADPSNFKHWGNSCVICDPWAGKVYPSHQIARELMTHHGVQFFSGRVFNRIDNFDPITHHLQPLYDNHQLTNVRMTQRWMCPSLSLLLSVLMLLTIYFNQDSLRSICYSSKPQ